MVIWRTLAAEKVPYLCGKKGMKPWIWMPLWVLLASLVACSPPQQTLLSVPVWTSYEQLQQRLQQGGDTTFVINFWATTCPPCREEMPLLEALQSQTDKRQRKVLLLSLDRPQDAATRVLKYAQEAGLRSELALLADPHRNVWTAKVDSSWYGALPATWVVRGSQQSFRFGAFEKMADLEKMVAEVEE